MKYYYTSHLQLPLWLAYDVFIFIFLIILSWVWWNFSWSCLKPWVARFVYYLRFLTKPCFYKKLGFYCLFPKWRWMRLQCGHFTCFDKAYWLNSKFNWQGQCDSSNETTNNTNDDIMTIKLNIIYKKIVIKLKNMVCLNFLFKKNSIK